MTDKASAPLLEDYMLVDHAEQQCGFEPPADPDTCPKCGDELIAGFGLMGGGYGPYWICDGNGCDFFYKLQVSDRTPASYSNKTMAGN